MKEFKVSKTWTRSLGLALLLSIFVFGCGREQARSPFPPTVLSVTPINGATNVLLNSTVTATFSSAMAPATINTTTFTVTAGGVGVAGTVSLAGATAVFTPATTLAANTLFVATITTGAKDPGGNALAANFVWSFTTGPPTIISTVPANGATAVAVNTLISATFIEVMNAATINGATFIVQGPGVTPVAGVVSYAGTTATFTPAAVLAANTLYTATITTGAQDPAGSGLAANFVWTFTTDVAPTVVSTVPAADATGEPVNTAVSATFSRAMNPVTINSSTFFLTGPVPAGAVRKAGMTPHQSLATPQRRAGSRTGKAPLGNGGGSAPGAVTLSSDGKTATITTALLAADSVYTATVTTGAADPTGNALPADFVWTFTTDVAPTVVSTVPVNGAVGIAVGAPITATFSRAMDASTLTPATFTVTGPGGVAVAGGVGFAGTVATFTPGAPLAFSTLYTATITTGAADPTGNALAANVVWTFTTSAQPLVTSTSPASGATNVPLNQKIIATFNQPMNSATVTAAGVFTVAVTGGGAAVAGTVTYDAASHSAIFTPTANLAASTQYTATVTTSAQSAVGTALASNYVWSFTTGTTTNVIAPTVTSTNPADAAVAVALNQKVAATFSTAMNPATLSAPGTFTVVVTAGGAAVAGTMAYDGASRTLVFTPSTNLAATTQYTATISNAAKDLAGNALIAGAAPNPWNFTTGALLNNVAPTITLTSPASGDTGVAIDKTISATFSAPLDPTTIHNGSFSVAIAGAGGAPVSGTVSYDSASQIATFHPTANLAASTQYTATILNTVTDLSGNALTAGLVPNPWNFTTGLLAGTGQAGVNLGSASTFAVLATSSISSTGPVIINGDVGLHPGTSQGLPPAQVNGSIHVNDTAASQAQTDLLAAYNDATNRSTNSQTLPGNMGGLTFTPGLYTNSTSVLISGPPGPGDNVTLDAQGDPDAVFIFQMGSTLTTGPGSQVILAGGAKAGNVYWVVGTSATIDTTSIFEGNILAGVSITLNTGAQVEGRMFAGSAGGAASVTVNASSVTVPVP